MANPINDVESLLQQQLVKEVPEEASDPQEKDLPEESEEVDPGVPEAVSGNFSGAAMTKHREATVEEEDEEETSSGKQKMMTIQGLQESVRHKVDDAMIRAGKTAVSMVKAGVQDASEHATKNIKTATRELKKSRRRGAKAIERSMLTRIYKQRAIGIQKWTLKVAKDRKDDATRRVLVRQRAEKKRKAKEQDPEEIARRAHKQHAEEHTEMEYEQRHLKRLADDVNRAKRLARRAAWEKQHPNNWPTGKKPAAPIPDEAAEEEEEE